MENESTDKLVFLLELTDGYSFRNLLDYLKSSNTDGNFLFSSTEITYSQNDGESVLLNILFIETCNLSKYIFNSKTPLLVGVQLSELQSNTKKVGKKDGIRMYMKQDDRNLYLQILSTNKGSRNNLSMVSTKDIDYFEYKALKFDRQDNNPNATSVINDFAKTCKNMGAYKCDYVIFQGFNKGVIMSAYLEGHLVGSAEKFGDCDTFSNDKSKYPDIRSIVVKNENNHDSPTEQKKVKLFIRPNDNIPIVKVPARLVTALGKTNNTSQNGIVKIFIENGKPIRFMFSIGYYAKLVVLIRDSTIESY